MHAQAAEQAKALADRRRHPEQQSLAEQHSKAPTSVREGTASVNRVSD